MFANVRAALSPLPIAAPMTGSLPTSTSSGCSRTSCFNQADTYPCSLIASVTSGPIYETLLEHMTRRGQNTQLFQPPFPRALSIPYFWKAIAACMVKFFKFLSSCVIHVHVPGKVADSGISFERTPFTQ